MVAKPETLNRFIFNSDYPTDKIIWLYEGQATSPSTVWADKEVTINLEELLGSSETIYVKGVWSIDDWQSSHMLGASYAAVTTSPDKYIDASLGWYGYNSETQEGPRLYVLLQTTGSAGRNKTVKFRLWGVQRDDVAMAIDYKKNSTTTKSKLIFNTDNNYPRLYKDGIASGGDVIEHNLGHVPYMDYWCLTHDPDAPVQDSWYAYPIGDLYGTPYPGTYVRATEKQVIFGDDGYGTKYYYRIYA